MSKFEKQLNDCKFVPHVVEVVRDFIADVDLRLATLEAAVFGTADEQPVPAEEHIEDEAPPTAEAVTDAPSESLNAEGAEDAEVSAEEPADTSQEDAVETAAAEAPPAELNKPAPKRRKA